MPNENGLFCPNSRLRRGIMPDANFLATYTIHQSLECLSRRARGGHEVNQRTMKNMKMNECEVTLTAAQANARYQRRRGQLNHKPVFEVPARSVLSLQSAFEHKQLSGGPTFSLGLLCPFSCSFCYVGTQLSRHPALLRIKKETGLDFQQMIVQKVDPIDILRRQLVDPRGRPRYCNPADTRVIFASPLVDVAANLEMARDTVKACRLILQNTFWHIRLLSKSALLKTVAEQLAEYRDRVIFGLSTGTFDDGLAASFELHASSPTARLRTLHWLQDRGYRTFGMLCPSLPQDDYAAFARSAAERIRVDRCEHVWAEVLNVRGESLRRTCAALRRKGFLRAADQLDQVSGPGRKDAWESYARSTFLAHAAQIPPAKLRFLQYVQKEHVDWWANQTSRGAVLLGKAAAAAQERPGRTLPRDVSKSVAVSQP
jgi:DNA repair photolyase